MEMTEYRPAPEPSPGSPAGEEFVYPGADESESPTALVWHYLRVLRRHSWKISGFVLAVVAATLLYALQLTPLYESAALIELANLNPMTRLGSDMVSYNVRNESKVIETQLRLINSPTSPRRWLATSALAAAHYSAIRGMGIRSYQPACRVCRRACCPARTCC